MYKAAVIATVAFLAGAAAAFALLTLDAVRSAPDVADSPVIDNVPLLSPAAAEAHRENRYRAIRSIEETLALPGDFAQTEALYLLAGRSDSAAVQNLIFQAHGIANPADRTAALDILFARLTELDPSSALALSRTSPFRSGRSIEAGVWQAWAKQDLDAALAAVMALDSPFERNLAAQSLYAAHGYYGNAATDHIEDSLRIPPNGATRAAHIFQLAERDPAEAIEAINAITAPSVQHELATYLGRHMGRLAGTAATRHAELFGEHGLRQVFRHAVAAAAAEADPESVLDELLAGPATMDRTMEAHRALQALAARDIEKALDYLDGIGNPRHRAMLAGTIAADFARADPDRALTWAAENDQGMHSGLLASVLAAIASTSPDKAIDEAQRLPNANQRQQALSMIAMTMSQRDPELAAGLLYRIERPQDRKNVARNIGTLWVHSDPDAAISWMLQQEKSERDDMLSMAGQTLAQIDIDGAMRWLPRLDERSQAIWRAQIASNLASQRSPAEALQFIARYEGSADYPQLLASAINGIAETDVRMALQMAERLPDGTERDGLYSGLIWRYALQDPEEAAGVLDSISDATQRARATGMLVTAWSHEDPERAQQWVEKLPRGDGRDSVVVQLASTWDELTPSRRLLMDSIGSPEKRRQALMLAVQRIGHWNPDQAEGMIRELNLTDEERQQLQQGVTLRAYP